MGQEQSSLLDDSTPPQILTERSLPAVAKLIKDGDARKIVVMTGAGLSTAAGIPDFRSPNTGLYANLARLNLPYAEAVFDISYFRENPDPFYVLARELYPGNYSPTISHVFITLLASKGLLKMLFTQNIDCLERQAGVPGELIVEAHGSFAEQRCIDCKTAFPDDLMKEHVFKGEVPRCTDKKCGGLVKPDIVFFGEQLPEAFHENKDVPATADLVLVLGTSLTVQPFASLPEFAKESTPRVLFNLERVGSLGTRTDDVLVLGDCDSGVRKLADELGWRDELEAKWRAVVGEKEAERQLRSAEKREAELQVEADDLADKVGEGLQVDDLADKVVVGLQIGDVPAEQVDESSIAPLDPALRNSLEKKLSHRPDQAELVEKNILPASSGAPGLAQQKSQKNMLASLNEKIAHRPSPDDLIENGMLNLNEDPRSPDEKYQDPMKVEISQAVYADIANKHKLSQDNSTPPTSATPDVKKEPLSEAKIDPLVLDVHEEVNVKEEVTDENPLGSA